MIFSRHNCTVPTHYLYLDETGTLDFESRIGNRYFGIGSAYKRGNHSEILWEGHVHRIELERLGVHLPKGVHAKNDSHPTRSATCNLIAKQGWSFDSTFLLKDVAPALVQTLGKAELYRRAISIHLNRIVQQVSEPGDEVVVLVASIVLSRRRSAARLAVEEICQTLNFDRTVRMCMWDAASAWGIQVADYALWCMRREVELQNVPDYARNTNQKMESPHFPWGK